MVATKSNWQNITYYFPLPPSCYLLHPFVTCLKATEISLRHRLTPVFYRYSSSENQHESVPHESAGRKSSFNVYVQETDFH